MIGCGMKVQSAKLVSFVRHIHVEELWGAITQLECLKETSVDSWVRIVLNILVQRSFLVFSVHKVLGRTSLFFI